MNYLGSQKVTKKRLRDIFNDPAFNIALQQQTTEWVLIYEELAPVWANEPEGTVSQVHEWYGIKGKLAVVHRYRRIDGSIGASGLPDPHSLLVDGKVCFDP